MSCDTLLPFIFLALQLIILLLCALSTVIRIKLNATPALLTTHLRFTTAMRRIDMRLSHGCDKTKLRNALSCPRRWAGLRIRSHQQWKAKVNNSQPCKYGKRPWYGRPENPTPSDSQLIQQVIHYKISYYRVTSTGSQSPLHAWQLEIITRVSHAQNAV